jgi:hypothetical protein
MVRVLCDSNSLQREDWMVYMASRDTCTLDAREGDASANVHAQ